MHDRGGNVLGRGVRAHDIVDAGPDEEPHEPDEHYGDEQEDTEPEEGADFVDHEVATEHCEVIFVEVFGRGKLLCGLRHCGVLPGDEPAQ